jgi:hypothetical protein
VRTVVTSGNHIKKDLRSVLIVNHVNGTKKTPINYEKRIPPVEGQRRMNSRSKTKQKDKPYTCQIEGCGRKTSQLYNINGKWGCIYCRNKTKKREKESKKKLKPKKSG